jgi:hypothetical protein
MLDKRERERGVIDNTYLRRHCLLVCTLLRAERQQRRRRRCRQLSTVSNGKQINVGVVGIVVTIA